MLNPLRFPIVLIVIFALMLLYVHAYHRRRAALNEALVPQRELLQLRQPPGSEPPINGRLDAAAPMDRSQDPGGIVASPLEANIAKSPSRLPLPTAAPEVPFEAGAAVPKASLIDPRELRKPDVPRSPSGRETATLPTSGTDPKNRLVLQSYLPDPDPPSTQIMHRIVDGDTLPSLAARYLGEPSRYMEILDANRDVLMQPDLLPLGVRIRIPAP